MTTIKSIDPLVSCPAAVTTGKVCAHAVTTAQLQGWGIDVRHTIADHIFEGTIDPGTAVHRAWQAGHVRMCTLDPRTTIRRRWTLSAESVAETLAWIETHLREEDRK